MHTATNTQFKTNAQVTARTTAGCFEINLVGDSRVGKSSILRKYFNQQFQEMYVPTTKQEYIDKTDQRI